MQFSWLVSELPPFLPSPTPYKRGQVIEILQKRGASRFFYKKGRVARGVVLKGQVSLTFIPTNLTNVIFLSVCGLYVLLIYTISMNMLCVSQEVLRLVESNPQMCHFCRCVIFEKSRQILKRQIQIAAFIYLHDCISLLLSMCGIKSEYQ